MALTVPNPIPALNGKYRTAWRVIFVVFSLALTSGITAVVFFFIPAVNDSVKLALREGGIIFVAAVIVPSGIFSAITTVWGIIILWKASEGDSAGGK